MEVDDKIVYHTLDKIAASLPQDASDALYIAVRRMHHIYRNQHDMRGPIEGFLERRTMEFPTHEERTMHLIKYNAENRTDRIEPKNKTNKD